MSDIAKKYVKALVASVDEKEIESFHQDLTALLPAFKNAKFRAITESHELSREKKSAFLMGFIESKSPKIENFVKLIVEKGRISLLPAIARELGRVIEEKTNSYKGRLISGQSIDKKAIKEIEETLSKRLGATISLENVVTTYPGMKVEIENLGLEIGLSMERIKQQIAQAILSAI